MLIHLHPANYARPPNRIAVQSAPVINYPRPASYQSAPQLPLPSVPYHSAPAPFMSALAYPSVGTQAANNSYQSYLAPSTAVPSYQCPTTKAAPYAASNLIPTSYYAPLLDHQFNLFSPCNL